MKRFFFLISILASFSYGAAKISVQADLETEPVQSSGDAADDATVWVHPIDVSQSVIVGTDKQWGLHVYDLSGKQVSQYKAGEVNNIDLRPDFNDGNEKSQILAGSARHTKSIDFYRMNPQTRTLSTIGSLKLSYEPYGLCIGYLGTQKTLNLLITTKSGRVDQYSVQNSRRGLSYTFVKQWKFSSVTEGCVVDDARGIAYIGEEDVGLWKVSLIQESAKPSLVDRVGSKGNLVADVEGVSIYDMPNRRSYLVVSSQGDNSFHVYDLISNQHLGKFVLSSSPSVDGVNDTDGIDVSSVSFNSQFPEGLMVIQDGSNKSPAGKSLKQNFKIVDWKKIRIALQLE